MAINYQVWFTTKYLVNGSFNINTTMTQWETGFALITGNIPDLFPLLRRFFPKFLRADSDELQPNPYPYPATSSGSGSGPGSGTGYSSRIRKMFASSGSNNTSPDDTTDDSYGMETFKWRGDEITVGDVQVQGRASHSSLTESQEAIIDEEAGKGGGIVKTTHFVIQEAHTRPSGEIREKRWSNI